MSSGQSRADSVLAEPCHIGRREKVTSVSAAIFGALCILAMAGSGCSNTHAPMTRSVVASEKADGAMDDESGTHRLLEAFVRHWFALLSSPQADVFEFEAFLPDEAFELTLFDRTLHDTEELRSWLEELRRTWTTSRYSVEAIEIEADAASLHRVRFVVTRDTVGSDGLPHIARRAQQWLLSVSPSAAPVILEAKETKLLSFPGTGPRVVCF